MRLIARLSALLAALFLLGGQANAQNDGFEVFIPISKYIAQGDSESLSAWFAGSLEMAVLAESSDCSRSQAKQIMKTFFDAHTPHSFEITHTAGRGNMKYALGNLSAGGETFLVTVFVSCKKGSYLIQQLKIERR